MSTDKEWQRLYALYADQGDNQLLALYDQRDGLTEIAREVLTQVLRERELTPQEEASSNSGFREDQAGKDAIQLDEIDSHERILWGFTDGSEAANAHEILSRSDITHRFASNLATSSDGRPSGQLVLVVDERDVQRSEAVLREAMGLFPLPEAPEDPDGPLGALENMTMLGIFDNEEHLDEAVGIAAALAKSGISFVWRDGRDSDEPWPEAGAILIEVRGKNLDRAQAVMHRVIADLPED